MHQQKKFFKYNLIVEWKASDMTNVSSNKTMKPTEIQNIKKLLNENSKEKAMQAINKRPCSTYREKYPDKAKVSAKVQNAYNFESKSKLTTYREAGYCNL